MRARRATESAIKAAEGSAEVLVGVGLDTATAISAARHAADAGASMVMIHQPVHPYVSGEGWIGYHEAIAEAVPDTGVVLYVRDTRIGGELIGRLGESCPNVIGVKYGVRDPVLFAAAARDAGPGRFTWLAGLAELTAPGLWAVGAQGFTSGLVNVAPAIPAAMLAALRRGDCEAAMTTGMRSGRSRNCAAPTLGRQRRASSRRRWRRSACAGAPGRRAGCCRARPRAGRSDPRRWGWSGRRRAMTGPEGRDRRGDAQ